MYDDAVIEQMIREIEELRAQVAELRGVEIPSETQLDSRYVNVAGDTMSGNLSIVKAGGTSLALRGAGSGDLANIELGAGGSGNRYAYIDLVGDDTYTDFGLRIVRQNGGANTNSEITHRGTGALIIGASEGPLNLTATNYLSGTWTPTVNQGGAVTCTVNHARYRVREKMAFVNLRVTITSAGVIGNGIIIGGQPAAIQPVAETLLGVSMLLDSGTAYYAGAVRAVTATNWQIFAHQGASSVGASPSFALASGDVIYMELAYDLP